MKIPSTLYHEGMLSKKQKPETEHVLFNHKVWLAQEYIEKNFVKADSINKTLPISILNIIFSQHTGVITSEGEFTLALLRAGFKYRRSNKSVFVNVDTISVDDAESKSCLTIIARVPLTGPWDYFLEKAKDLDPASLKTFLQEFLVDKPQIAPYNLATLVSSLSKTGIKYVLDHDGNVIHAAVATTKECLHYWNLQVSKVKGTLPTN